ncbi:hypothetical protein EV193_102228 [Herbihabitans rhizosphaerae]|uniref:Uncharacterized protein n=1 Tax=Herbihabitans rhizosphaerae TaxID=1872711 RepID=A0A4Q7L176_9PSEU|nr:hypothetical protein [Herbihabitans rhizosphaerae]RZS43249.1 hypothetical protein EV193_102228 [Herbihabitans rhizosphaerae]
MTDITSIELNLETGELDDAGTDGDVYLGICGREFFADTSGDDYEKGSSNKYVFGSGANVNNADINDPREQRLQVEYADLFPVYLRFEPQNRDDRWRLQRAVVTFNGNLFPMYDTNETIPLSIGIWMGTHPGQFVFIRKHQPG